METHELHELIVKKVELLEKSAKNRYFSDERFIRAQLRFLTFAIHLRERKAKV